MAKTWQYKLDNKLRLYFRFHVAELAGEDVPDSLKSELGLVQKMEETSKRLLCEKDSLKTEVDDLKIAVQDAEKERDKLLAMINSEEDGAPKKKKSKRNNRGRSQRRRNRRIEQERKRWLAREEKLLTSFC